MAGHLGAAAALGGPAATDRCRPSPPAADRLPARIGRAALPHVLAAHLHPGAAAAPAGLLLVSPPAGQARAGPRGRGGAGGPAPLQVS